MDFARHIFCYVILSLGAIGCSANHNTAFRNFSVDDGSGAMVDIKQRAIISSRQPYEIYNATTEKYDKYEKFVVCAEPSPDALSAYAAELAAEGGNGQVSASLAAATQETAAYVGLRTQSIQLLRDAFYRACEGYMGGALTPVQFDILTRRYQRYMVALLGIEQLTGTVKAPPVTLTTEGRASAAQSLASLRAQKESINAEIAKLEGEKQAQQAIIDDSSASAGKKETATAKKAEIEQKIAGLEEDKAAIQTGIHNAQGVAAGGSTAATVSQVGMPGQRSESALENVSKTVGEIVKEVLRTDDLTALCLANLSADANFQITDAEFKRICKESLDGLTAAKAAQSQQNIKLVDAIISYISKKPSLTASDIVTILGSLENFQTESATANSIKMPQ